MALFRTKGLHPIVPAVGIGALAGLASALLYVGSATGTLLGIMLSFFTALPLFVAGLGWGLPAAGMACLISAGGLAIAGGHILGGMFLVSLAAPAALLSHLALLARPGEPLPQAGGPPDPLTREWYPAGSLALWISGLAVVMFLGFEVFVAGFDGGLRGTVIHAFSQIAPEGSDLRHALLAYFPGWTWDRVVHLLATISPAAAGVSWQMMMVCNGLLAQMILSASHRSIRPGFAPMTLTLPRALAGVLALALGLALFGGQIGFIAGTIAALLYVPYFFLGLSVVHAIPLRGAGRTLMLALFYFLILTVGWLSIAVGILGLVEQWAEIRARFVAAKAAREDK